MNSELWHACAGPLVSLPTVGSRVVYFPQGHSEQVVCLFSCLFIGFYLFCSWIYIYIYGFNIVRLKCHDVCLRDDGPEIGNQCRLQPQLTKKLMLTYQIIRACRPS